MRRIAVVSSARGWHAKDLVRALSDHGVDANFIDFRSFVASIGGAPERASERRDLSEFDALLIRTMSKGGLEQIVYRMDVLNEAERAGGLILNSPAAIEIAIDKYRSLSRLASDGIPVPRTVVCESIDDARRAFGQLGGNIVVKPLFGSEGKDLHRFDDPQEFEDFLRVQQEGIGVLYLQEYIEHPGFDHRLFVIGDRVLAGMKRSNSTHWITNIARGGVAENWIPDRESSDLAIRAARAVRCDIAGVDLVRDTKSGNLRVLEVNAAPGWKALQESSGIDVAGAIVDYALKRIEASAETAEE